jgi:hypothetical protein
MTATPTPIASSLTINGVRYAINSMGDNFNVRRKIIRKGVSHWRTVKPGTDEHRSVWVAWKRSA